MSKIKSIIGREILDSRGIPTIEVAVELEDSTTALAAVSSGVAAGNFEAVELRDNDQNRYQGLGVLKVVENINQIIAPKLIGQDVLNQTAIDRLLVELDGTANKSKYGVNAILPVSQSICCAAAKNQKISLFRYLNQLAEKGGFPKVELKIPTPTFNLINGGSHGAGNLEFQEFHIIPSSSRTYSENLEMAGIIYQSVKQVLIRHNAIHSVGDEGGFAPNLFTNLDAFEIIVEAIKSSNHSLGRDLYLGLDVAPRYFFKDKKYVIRDRASPMDTNSFVEFLYDLQVQYPLILLEDPLVDDDWEGWIKITREFGSRVTIVGDDFLCTNLKRVREAITKKACNAILIKPNQVGTISELLEIIKICRQANWKISVSHRSGETNDTFIADLAVAVGADYVKFGAPARGERVAKYNRLLNIEKELASNA